LPAVLLMLGIGGVAVVLPGAAMVLTGLMGTLSGGIHADNFTFRHFAALFARQGMRCRRWAPAFRWRWRRR
jgi:iron(III) transport system permease protein